MSSYRRSISPAHYRRLDRLRRSAEVAELAALAADMWELADKLRGFSLAHRGGCKCVLCSWVRDFESYPNSLDAVLCAATAVRVLVMGIDGARPRTDAEEEVADKKGGA